MIFSINLQNKDIRNRYPEKSGEGSNDDSYRGYSIDTGHFDDDSFEGYFTTRFYHVRYLTFNNFLYVNRHCCKLAKRRRLQGLRRDIQLEFETTFRPSRKSSNIDLFESCYKQKTLFQTFQTQLLLKIIL